MIFIQFDGNGNELFKHFKPFDPKHGLGKTEEELREIGVLVESIPEPEQIAGKEAVLKYDGTSLYYEYVDIPLSDMEQLRLEMAQSNTELFETMLTLMGGA